MMTTTNTNPALRERFPLGCEVINLGSVHAVVWSYYEHGDGSCDLVLRELRAGGRVSRSQWVADPSKCVRVR